MVEPINVLRVLTFIMSLTALALMVPAYVGMFKDRKDRSRHRGSRHRARMERDEDYRVICIQNLRPPAARNDEDE